MKFISSPLLVAAGFAAIGHANPLERRACVADNCLRALTVLDSNLKSSRPVMARSDCSEFMKQTTTLTFTPTVSTVYPTATSVLSTTTTTFTPGTITSTLVIPTTLVLPYVDIAAKKRGDHEELFGRGGLWGTTLPTYLTACVSAARLSSACSCIGIPATTVTVSTTLPTVTSTISKTTTSTASFTEIDTLTATSTTTTLNVVATTTALPTFWLRASGTPVDGWYANNHYTSYGGIQYDHPIFAASTSDAITCTHDADTRQLTCNGILATFNDCSYSFMMKKTPTGSYSVDATCDILPSGEIICDKVVGGLSTVWQSCTQWWVNAAGEFVWSRYLSQKGGTCVDRDCQDIQLFAQYV